MQSIATTSNANVEIISAYATQNQDVPAVDPDDLPEDTDASGWYTIGTFFLPVNTKARLEAIGLVTDLAATMKVRLFDQVAAAPVSGTSVTIHSLSAVRAVSGTVALTGNRIYQFQAQALGTSGQGLVCAAQLT